MARFSFCFLTNKIYMYIFPGQGCLSACKLNNSKLKLPERDSPSKYTESPVCQSPHNAFHCASTSIRHTLYIPLGPSGHSAWHSIVNPLGHCLISVFPCHLCFCPCLPAEQKFLCLGQRDFGSALELQCHRATLRVWDGWGKERKMYKLTLWGEKAAVMFQLTCLNSYVLMYIIT